MKAYSLHNINELRYEDIAVPESRNGWAIVKVKAAGICSSDISRVFIKGTYHFPTIPGHEFSGEVYSVASSEYAHLVGKKVGVFPLIPCRSCPQCAEKRYEICENYDYLGSRRDGGFAECVAVPVWNLIELPENISFIEGAMMEPLSVALHAVRRGNIKKGDNVAIVGTGMIGISAGQWARILGAGRVTIIGRNESKRRFVEQCALEYNLCTDPQEIGQYDLVIEAVGSPSSIELAISGAVAGGRVVLMGNPSGDICFNQKLYWRVLRKQLVITGTWNSTYNGKQTSDWTEVVEVLKKREIDSMLMVSHVFTQERLMEGLRLMYENKEPYCKVMTIWNQ